MGFPASCILFTPSGAADDDNGAGAGAGAGAVAGAGTTSTIVQHDQSA